MYIGKDNKYHRWEMEEVWLEAVENRKDLSEVTDKTMKFSRQCLQARNRPNKILKFINRNLC